VALRTFVGSICTLASSIVNLSVLMALEGEPGWVCLMCCNSDSKKISFSTPHFRFLRFSFPNPASPLQRHRHPMGNIPR